MAQYQIRLARRDDIPLLPEIELDAATRFPVGAFPAGMENKVLPMEIYDLARSAGQLWVATDATDRALSIETEQGLQNRIAMYLKLSHENRTQSKQ
jgi:hypothetical protein